MPFLQSLFALPLLLLLAATSEARPYTQDDRAFTITAPDESRTLRVSFYGDAMVRLQTTHDGAPFLPDDYYEMVQTHDWTHCVTVSVSDHQLVFSAPALEVAIDRDTLAAKFTLRGASEPVLRERQGAQREGTHRIVRFAPSEGERFTGLGHGYFARAASLELTGTVVERNYGRRPIEQAPLLVPFYLSSFGYGVFLNSTFPNRFAFNVKGDVVRDLAADGDTGNNGNGMGRGLAGGTGDYSMAIDTHGYEGQLDYFFIAGPRLVDVLDRYTQLTGRPRLPMKSMFGLQLSDKGHDHTSDTPSDERWWKAKILAHREAGLPLDHVVNDNRWRAAGGKRCESKIEWDAGRYPDPAAWKRWLDAQGLVSTLDFNRCIARLSDGWQPAFNLPPIDDIEFANSAPDLTNGDFRAWFWQIFYDKSLDPSLAYPGDALWIDEFDEQGAAPLDLELASGRRSAEMRNYWFFLIAKALVAEGWDASDLTQRPFVWVRGMTAGAQRYATLWSGDIKPNEEDMAAQIRAMQLAGLAGFPYWGHDAGGFYDWDEQVGPDESLYQRWAMAFGSFAPIWKPHGMGQSRWPLDRSEASLASAHRYGRLRYELMPYLYSVAHEAAETGLPMTRPMLLEHPDVDEAWAHDLQYFFGPNLLVAPSVLGVDPAVWLPPGDWYALGDETHHRGGQVVALRENNEQMVILARAGAIIPKREYAQSTAFIDKTQLIIDVHAGADGAFRLIEDDDRTEAYRQGERRVTWLRYDDRTQTLTVDAAQGDYSGAAKARSVVVNFVTREGSRSIPVGSIPVDRAEHIALNMEGSE
ncbi:MAG: TIM-barrel domain-containing protein [Pseudomonadota bacterium]